MENELVEYKRLYKLLDEYSELLRIDKHDLDTALIEQANIYYRIGEAYAEAISNKDYSKSQLDQIRADADKYIREEAQRENQRVTEAQVANSIALDETYKTAYNNYLMWKTLADKWLALRDSFNQRAYSLRDLVNLYAMNYWPDSIQRQEKLDARDRVATDVREFLAEKRRETKKRVRLEDN